MGLTRTPSHDSHFVRRRLPLCPLFLADGDVRLFRLPGPRRRRHRARLLSRGAGDRLLRDADRLVEVRGQQFGLVAVSELAGTFRTCLAHQLQAVPTVSVPMTDMRNLDEATVAGFGKEWSGYDQTVLGTHDLNSIFESYFAIFPFDELPPDAEGFDLGCGSGRWADLVLGKVGRLHCIDPSQLAL